MDLTTRQLVYSEVLLFLDWDPFQRQEYLKLELKSGRTLTITPTHLVITETTIIYAKNLTINNTMLVYRNGKDFQDSIVNITRVFRTGIYAPLTKLGTLIANDVVVSCYAVVNNHWLAHWMYAPIRLAYILRDNLIPFISANSLIRKLTKPSQGVHWYAKTLYEIAKNYSPWQIIDK